MATPAHLVDLRDDALGVPRHKPVAELLDEVAVDGGHAAEEPGIQDGGEDMEVVAGHLQGFRDGARGITHLHFQVPQGVDHLLNEGTGLVWDLLFEEKEDVHVRVEAVLAPAVSTQGHNGEGMTAHGQGLPRLALSEAPDKVVVHGHRALLEEFAAASLADLGFQFFSCFFQFDGCRLHHNNTISRDHQRPSSRHYAGRLQGGDAGEGPWPFVPHSSLPLSIPGDNHSEIHSFSFPAYHISIFQIFQTSKYNNKIVNNFDGSPAGRGERGSVPDRPSLSGDIRHDLVPIPVLVVHRETFQNLRNHSMLFPACLAVARPLAVPFFNAASMEGRHEAIQRFPTTPFFGIGHHP